MRGFLAAIQMIGEGLVYVQPLSATDPGFGGGIGAGGDPGYDRPTFPHPGQGLPGGGGRPDQGLPGFGHPGNWVPGGWGGRPDQGLPGQGGHPGNALPVPPVRPAHPIVIPPGVWPPTLPPNIDNTLPPGPPGYPEQPIVIPPDPSIGISQPIVLPTLPPGAALLIALPQAQPKAGDPPNAKPAILYQGAGTKPVLVYVSASPPTAAPK